MARRQRLRQGASGERLRGAGALSPRCTNHQARRRLQAESDWHCGAGAAEAPPSSAAFDGGRNSDGWPHTASGATSDAFDGCGARQDGAVSAKDTATSEAFDARGCAVDSAARDFEAAETAATSDALESAGVGVGAAVAAAPAPVASATAAAAAGTQASLWSPVVQCCRWQAGLQ